MYYQIINQYLYSIHVSFGLAFIKDLNKNLFYYFTNNLYY